ncbi:MAG TPA: hypothetical protein VGR47_16845 [Terracidiphilus sp.]|nr:hypothetical protein [Terracidiphilus sp.]
MSSKTAICTLFEGDYHFGLVAFVNSLVHAGYKGTIFAGYRGELPPWLDQLRRSEYQNSVFTVTSDVQLVFRRLDTRVHLTNYKPQFMLDLLAGDARDCEYLWYFDPDIFLVCPWSFFARWQLNGIALCEEIVNYNLSENSPIRFQWVNIGTEMGLNKPRLIRGYFNGGVVGVSSAHISFLCLWKQILDKAVSGTYNLELFKPGTPDMPFNATDQDALNMAVMYTEFPLTTMGPEAMGFVPSGFTMYHSVGHKPWRGSFILRALSGRPPSNAAKFFFKKVSSPIHAYSQGRLAAKRLACYTAAFIGRIYARR